MSIATDIRAACWQVLDRHGGGYASSRRQKRVTEGVTTPAATPYSRRDTVPRRDHVLPPRLRDARGRPRDARGRLRDARGRVTGRFGRPHPSTGVGSPWRGGTPARGGRNALRRELRLPPRPRDARGRPRDARGRPRDARETPGCTGNTGMHGKHRDTGKPARANWQPCSRGRPTAQAPRCAKAPDRRRPERPGDDRRTPTTGTGRIGRLCRARGRPHWSRGCRRAPR